MHHPPALLVDVVLILAAAIPIALLLRRVQLPAMAGYLVAGALLGPKGLGWIGSKGEVEAMAEVGVALLLFTVGLEFSIPRLLLMRRVLLVGGGLQVAGTILGVALLSSLAGADVTEAVLYGFLACLSSTALVLKQLADGRELEAPHGRFTVAVLLFQDLAVIPLMLAVPLLAGGNEGTGTVAILLVAAKAVGAVAIVLLSARYGFSRAASLVVRRGGRELFVLFVVLAALGAALLTQALSLPLALGAFVAGLVISESEYSHQVVSEILPFRDVFNALFFVSIGMLFDARLLVEDPGTVLALGLILAAVKGGVLFMVARKLTGSRATALLVAAALFQIGEFSFVLARQASSVGLLDPASESRFLAVAVISLFVSPFVMLAAPRLAQRLRSAHESEVETNRERSGVDVVVAGYGLNGRHLARVLSSTGIPYRVIEMNPGAVRSARSEGVPIQFGDVSRRESLEHAGVPGAKVVVIAINDPAATRRALVLSRDMNPEGYILVRTRYFADFDELLRLGATQVVPEEFETSVALFSAVLRQLHVPRGTIAVQSDLVRREGYQMLRLPEADAFQSFDAVRQILAETAVDTLFVDERCGSCGRTLGELDFRKRSGALVLSIARNGKALETPGPDHRFEPGDLVVVLGNHTQIERARRIVAGDPLEDE